MATPNFSTIRKVNWTYDLAYAIGSPAPTYNTYIGQNTIAFETQTVVSVNTPNFKRLKRWQYPQNPYSKSYGVWTDPPSLLVQKLSPTNPALVRTYSYANTTAASLGALTATSVLAVNDPTQKVIAKIMNQLSSGREANLAVSLIEANKTAKMVAETATRLAGAIRALRRVDLAAFTHSLGITLTKRETRIWTRNVTKFKPGGGLRPFEWKRYPSGQRYRSYKQRHPIEFSNVESFAANTWLEFTYGWKPLLQDIYNSAEASAALGIAMNNEVRVVTASSRDSSRYDNIDYRNQFRYDRFVQHDMSVFYKVWYRIENGGPSFVKAFGLDNPALVLWEVLPFSFVVDWFLPIGKSLESLTAYNGLTFVGGIKSSRLVTKYSSRVSPGKAWQTGDGLWTVEKGNFENSGTNVTISRSFLGSFPYYGLPQFKNPLSVSHATSALALLQSLFVGKAR